jgi:biotin carboxyl carrier protein
MYQVKVNGKFDHTVNKSADQLLVNGNPISADIEQLGPLNWHIINNLQSYNVEVVAFDSALKTAEIKVNNHTYHITAKDKYDALLEQMGLSNMNTAKIREVKAPMPGMVLKVFVAVGDQIKKGDNLFILEAMKMENIIKSPDDVTVKVVKIKPGDKVEKGKVLVQFA